VVVPDGELDGARLAGEVAALIGDTPRLERMAAASRSLSRPDAAERIAEGILDVARSPKS
jgi:UDP-N-acetylglucosamine--N-acetylmuramyl-(pentapeptide) pyrophosphoryl-undecaprenol N-acetylglucosamine transferase